MKDRRALGERVSDKVASFGGSWSFIFIFIIILIAWVAINSLSIFSGIVFDKPPFILLNLFLSTTAALQAPIILMSQNRATKHQDEVYRGLFARLESLILKQDFQEESVDFDRDLEIMNLKKELQAIKQLLKQSESEK